MLHFFKKRQKKNVCRYHYQNLNNVIYSSWDIEQNILKLVTHFLPFWAILGPFSTPPPPPHPPEKQTFENKNEKNAWRHYPFIHTCVAYILKYMVQQTKIFVILGSFLPFQPPDSVENQNFKIQKKNTWRFYHLTHLHHKWQSYDAWFLRYGARHTEFLVILDCFLPFYLPMDPEN